MQWSHEEAAMPGESGDFALIYDPENGFQLLDLTTNEVADLAVLESTWRKRGEEPSAGGDVTGHELPPPTNLKGQPVPAPQPGYLQNMTTLQFGALRLRSTGLLKYEIADPRVSLRDDQSQQP